MASFKIEKLHGLASKLFKYSIDCDSSEIMHNIMAFLQNKLEFVGQGLYSEDYSPLTIRGLASYSILVTFALIKFNDLVLNPQNTNEILWDLAVISLLIHVSLKFVVSNVYHKNVAKLASMIVDYHKRTAKLSPKHAEKLKEWSANISCIVFVIVMIFFSLGIADLIFVYTFYVNSSSFLLLFAFLTLAFYMYQLTLSTIAILITHMYVQYKSMMLSVEQLEELILNNTAGSKDVDIQKKIADIVNAQVELIEYMHICNELFSPYFLVEFTFIIPEVAALLTRISMSLDVYNEQVGVAMCLVGVLNSCLFGSLVEVQHEEYFRALCDISWVNLSVKQRKLFHMMLVATMDTYYIQCGIWNYNLEMFVSLCNSSYSYLNILLSLKA
jgi:7tm Odorant receptor